MVAIKVKRENDRPPLTALNETNVLAEAVASLIVSEAPTSDEGSSRSCSEMAMGAAQLKISLKGP